MSLSEYLAGWDAGIDEMLFRDPATLQTSHPGRMAPTSAACLDEAVAAMRAHSPDLVILDHFIQGQVMGLEAAPMLKVVSPTTKILLFSDHDLAVEAAREPAIDAYLPKSRLTALRSTVLSLLSLTDRR